MLQPCPKCSGRVMLDRAYCNYGRVETFCIKCGKRWEYDRTHPIAMKLNRIERLREYSQNGLDINLFHSQ